MLPFNLPPAGQEIQPTTHLVEDGLGRSLLMPRFGCLTWIENAVYKQYTFEAERDTDLLIDEYYFYMVEKFLRCRFNVAKDISTEQMFTYPDGTAVGQAMIDALWIYFCKERDRWPTETDTEETDSDPKPKAKK